MDSRPLRTNRDPDRTHGYLAPELFLPFPVERDTRLGCEVFLDYRWMYDIKHLTLSGGGVKGYAYVGAIMALDEAFFQHKRNLYQQLEGVSGTSIGALFALLMVMGVRRHQLMQEVMSRDIARGLEDMSIENLVNMHGMCWPTLFRKSTYDLLEKYVGRGDITFQELYELTHKYYVCCVTNVRTNQPEYHSHQSTPHYKVYESVTASMCIPLLFAPCIIQGQCYVDGGLTDNCPFRVFPLEHSLILRITSGYERAGDTSTLTHYIGHLLTGVFRNFDEARTGLIPTLYRERVVNLALTDVSPFHFTVDVATKKRLLAKGRKVMERCLNPHVRLQECGLSLTRILWLHTLRTWLDRQREDTECTETTPTDSTAEVASTGGSDVETSEPAEPPRQ